MNNAWKFVEKVSRAEFRYRVARRQREWVREFRRHGHREMHMRIPQRPVDHRCRRLSRVWAEEKMI